MKVIYVPSCEICPYISYHENGYHCGKDNKVTKNGNELEYWFSSLCPLNEVRELSDEDIISAGECV